MAKNSKCEHKKPNRERCWATGNAVSGGPTTLHPQEASREGNRRGPNGRVRSIRRLGRVAFRLGCAPAEEEAN
jgi:hypothetical protein